MQQFLCHLRKIAGFCFLFLKTCTSQKSSDVSHLAVSAEQNISALTIDETSKDSDLKLGDLEDFSLKGGPQ